MISTLLFLAAAVLIVVRLGLLARLHRTGSRDPIHDAVSDYGVGSTRATFDVMGAAATAAWWLLALGTWLGHPGWGGRGSTALALLVVGLTTGAMRFFPTDLPGERRTVRGLVHYGLAITQFALLYSTMGPVMRMLGDPLSPVLHAIALVSLVGLCACLLPPVRRVIDAFGLFERIFLVSIACFYLEYAVLSLVRGA